MKWLRFTVMLGLCFGQTMAETEVITGVRTWHMADGKSRRLKLIMLTPDGQHAYFSDGQNRGPIPAVAVSSLVPEERALLEGVHSGKVKLCKVEGLSMQLSWPTGKAPEYLTGLQAGEAREWKHVNGKSIQARLVNLTDDDVSLLVGETFSLVSIRDLSEADREHLEKVKRGNAAVAFNGSLELLSGGWDKGPSYSISVSSERFAELGELGGNFQKALDAALKAAGEKLPEGKWKFISLREFTCSRPNFAAADVMLPMLYEATFALEGAGVREARNAWPLTVTPVQWPADPYLILNVTADGEILKAQRQ